MKHPITNMILGSLMKTSITAFLMMLFFSTYSQTDIHSNGAAGFAVPGGSQYSVGAITQNNNNGITDFSTTTSPSTGYSFSLNGATVGASGTNNLGLTGRVGSLNTSAGGSAFIEFTITPNSGYGVNISAINFGSRATSTGPQMFSIQYSAGASGFSSAATGVLLNNSVWAYHANGVNISGSIGQPVIIRLYGYNGTGSQGTNFANWRLDDIVVSVTTALPVTFGDVAATIANKQLHVSWATLKETRNDHFEIEASTNGSDFKVLKTVATQNGDADAIQFYTVNLEISDIHFLLSASVLSLLLGFGIGHKRRWRHLGFVLVASTLFTIACTKETSSIDKLRTDKIFIRVKQVDRDGQYQYSKTVQVVNK